MSTVEARPVTLPARHAPADEHAPAPVSLDDKYAAGSGRALMSGIHALVRLLLEQRRLDARRGLDTGIFVSGYQGSPLGGLDKELEHAREHLDPLSIVCRPGLNEELAATSVSGTQLLGELPEHDHDGIVGVWYGKNPGLDRAADAIRHSTITGTAPLGGAVALIGDDPAAKSSTLPSACEPLCRSLMMPLLAPSSIREIVTLGLHAVALSRESGLWSGLKIVSEIADGSAIVDVGELATGVPAPSGRTAEPPPVLLGASTLDAEYDAMTARLDRVHAYARRTGLNHVAYEPDHPRTAIVAAGVAFAAVQRALDDLGFDESARQAAGLRLVKLGMPWPLEAAHVRELLHGVEQVLVVEDKLAFVESQLKEALFRCPDAPLILGKRDAHDRPLLSERSTLGADDIARALARVLGHELLPVAGRARLAVLDPAAADTMALELPALPARSPYFCSGCPHNSSTKADDDQLVGVGIGCHVMVVLDDHGRGQLLGMPQMGGEGAQWLGLAPFAKGRHFVQNLGDGTFHHSGSLAIRAAVAAGVDMTYKLLYNDAVAMTGGQRAVGRMSVPDITRLLAVEGVQRIIVTTPEPGDYEGVAIDPIATVRHRDDLPEAQRELAATPGVTVLIHDDRCATEERRMRKRGELDAPAQHVLINERVCEGCGDCGEQSTCLSVVPVDTPFGRKTHIHQASCSQDFSCLKGDCPSFMEVIPGRKQRTATPELTIDLPEPVLRVGAAASLRMLGIGGTGVLTISQILQMAAHLDGRSAAGVDQTGLAQKGGPVTSDLRIGGAPIAGTGRASSGSADVLRGFDVLGAAGADALAVGDPERTIAIVNTTQVATAAMVTDPAVHFPPTVLARAAINRVTRSRDNLFLDAGDLCERLFGDHMPANMLVVGAAYQHGCLPLSAGSIEAAIRLNGVAVDTNLAAFAWGRASAADPDAVHAALAPPAPPEPAPPSRKVRAILASIDADGELREVLERCVPELAAYQNARYARAYADDVQRVAATERERTAADATPVATAYAHGLHKLMAYKDEYEVARLYLDPVERARIAAEFGAGARVRVLLHPPALRALGLKRKLRLGPWIYPVFGVLRALRGLRGTPLDPFGHAQVRKVERRLITEYDALVAQALEQLRPQTADAVRAVAELPDIVRGYEDIKLRSVERFRERAAELLEDLAQPERAPLLQILPMAGTPIHAERATRAM